MTVLDEELYLARSNAYSYDPNRFRTHITAVVPRGNMCTIAKNLIRDIYLLYRLLKV